MGNLSSCDTCLRQAKQSQKELNIIPKPNPSANKLELENEKMKNIAVTQPIINSAIEVNPIYEQQIVEEKENLQNKPKEEPAEPVTKVHYPKYFQVYLTADESWNLAMQNNGQFPLKINQIYQEISNIQQKDELWSKKVVKRSGFDNKKIQLLFKQHIPLIGKYFFQVELVSFLPTKKCDFTIGVVDYDFAKDQIHSRDSKYEQSYTHIDRRLNIEQADKNKPIQLNMRFKVQITRQQQPYIAFFINEQEHKRQKLKETLQKELILIVPYIQTQYEGIIFSWRSALKRSISAYRISTIFEEPSSIISA